MTQELKPSLYRKLAAIAGAIEAVVKDGKNKDQGYLYATPGSVMLAVKPLMAKHNIAIVPHQVGYEVTDTGQKAGSGKPYVMNIVDMHYHILDGDSGEEMVAPWKGQAGTYGDDKGNAKAQTIALRTFLIQLFQIPAEDPEHDPDRADPRETTHPRGATYVPPLPARPAPPSKRPMTRDGLIARFTATLEQARALGIKTPAYEPTTMSDTDMIKVGTELKDLIELEKASAPHA